MAPGPHSRGIAITGAGSGLGAALARHYAAAGYAVAVTDIDAARADAVAAQIIGDGGAAFALGLDVTSADAWSGLYQRVMDEWGGLDILVNNAGVAGAGRLEDTPLADWRWLLEIDLFGVIQGCHRFLPLLREQGRGHVVNIASFAGMTPVPEVSAYATAKAAVVALSEQLRVDLAGSGVGVTVVCPAYVQTRLLETFRTADQRHRSMAERWMARSPVTAEQVAAQVRQAVARRQFLLLTHPETRWLWRFRRWLPERYHRMMVRMADRLRQKDFS